MFTDRSHHVPDPSWKRLFSEMQFCEFNASVAPYRITSQNKGGSFIFYYAKVKITTITRFEVCSSGVQMAWSWTVLRKPLVIDLVTCILNYPEIQNFYGSLGATHLAELPLAFLIPCSLSSESVPLFCFFSLPPSMVSLKALDPISSPQQLSCVYSVKMFPSLFHTTLSFPLKEPNRDSQKWKRKHHSPVAGRVGAGDRTK